MREAVARTPGRCLALPRSAPPRGTFGTTPTERPENPRGHCDTHQDLSRHLRAGRRERGRQESEAGPERVALGHGGGVGLRAAPRGRGPPWGQGGERHLSLAFGLELVNYKNVHR